MYSTTIFKKVLQYQMETLNNAKRNCVCTNLVVIDILRKYRVLKQQVLWRFDTNIPGKKLTSTKVK